MGNKLIWTLGIVLIIMVIVTISSGLFNVWTFLAIFYFIFLHIGVWLFLRNSFKKMKEDEDVMNRERKKFPWCWSRVNYHLTKFGGGVGLDWNKGYSSDSRTTRIGDGRQEKHFRSMRGLLQSDNPGDQARDVLVIYNIDDDDIAEFITEPLPDKLNDHFLGFKPFQSSVNNINNPNDRFGQHGNEHRYGQGQAGYNPYNNPNQQNYGGGYPPQEQPKPSPSPDAVNSVIAKIK